METSTHEFILYEHKSHVFIGIWTGTWVLIKIEKSYFWMKQGAPKPWNIFCDSPSMFVYVFKGQDNKFSQLGSFLRQISFILLRFFQNFWWNWQKFISRVLIFAISPKTSKRNEDVKMLEKEESNKNVFLLLIVYKTRWCIRKTFLVLKFKSIALEF